METKTSHYKRKLVKELCFGNILAAQELSLLTGKSLPLTMKMLSELVKEGLVKESGYALSTGGRRPLMYSLVSRNMYVISVAMDQLVTKIGIIDIQDYKISDVKKYDLNLYEHSNELVKLTECLNDFIDLVPIEKNKIIGVGIGMPGFVDVDKGVNYSFLDNDSANITEFIERAIGLPVYIDNDSSLIALAEFRLGSARNRNNAAVINFGWGVGLGMILNGELFRGNNGFAGEFSHIHLFENNKLCSCGKCGCLETEASMTVVLEKVKEAVKLGRVSLVKNISDDFEESFSTIMNAALKGDQLAVEALSATAYNIGRGIAILINILNPELIVISGRGAASGNMLLVPIQQAVNKYCIPRLANYSLITVSSFSNSAELIGGAALVIENYGKKTAKNSLKNKVA